MAIYTLQNTLLPVTGPAPFFLGGGGGQLRGKPIEGEQLRGKQIFFGGGGQLGAKPILF